MDASSLRSRPAGWLIQVFTISVLYVSSGLLGLEFASVQENATLVWAPVGVSLAALTLYGLTLWPGVLIGSLTLSALGGTEPVLNLAIAVGNTLEATVGAAILVRVSDFRSTLERVRDAALLVLVGGVFATGISTVVGVSSLWLSGAIAQGDLVSVASVWWRGNFAGVVVVSSFIMVLRNGSPPWPILFRQREFWLVFGALALSCTMAFGGDAIPLPWESTPLTQLPLACLVWAGIRLGTRGAALVLFVTVVAAIAATAQGYGPFVAEEGQAGMLRLWAYAVGMAITSLMLSAAVSQRNFAEERAREEFAQGQRVERERLLLEERERLVRDVHDGVGSQLVSVLSMVQRGDASADEIAESLRRTIEEIRSVIDSLDAGEISLHERLGRLRSHIGPLIQRNGIRLLWDIEDSVVLKRIESEPGRALHMIRIIQEAVANVVQHARASEVRVRVGSYIGGVEIEISDNGNGRAAASSSPGRGMRNMRARAEALKAELILEPANPGFRVLVKVPPARPTT